MLNHRGLIAAPPTGFLEDGKVDYAVIAPLISHLSRQGVKGVFINGTTGEGMSLTQEERMQLAECWKEQLPEDMLLMVHVGDHSIETSRMLALHARDLGVDAISSIAPSFYRPEGIEGVIQWCGTIASSTPELPFYFYYMPSMNGVRLNIVRFLGQAQDRIPNLAGVKFTDEAMGDFLEATDVYKGRFNILWGRDEMLLGALAMGAQWGVGSMYNIGAPVFLKLISAFERGEVTQARELQLHMQHLLSLLNQENCFFSALKSVLRFQGVPISSKTRSPLKSLTDDQVCALKKRYENIPFIITPPEVE